jgi:rod shape-determining protein MreB
LHDEKSCASFIFAPFRWTWKTWWSAKTSVAFPLDEELSFEVRGRNLIEGIPKTITISDEEIREALQEPVTQIIEAVTRTLELAEPELAADAQASLRAAIIPR